MEERLQKFLANSGVASRRKSEEYILSGDVTVNGKVVSKLGTKIDTDVDVVTFKGKRIANKEKKIYILLNKPIGYVTTAKDQFGRDTVLDLVKVNERVVPVGRLDMYTSGALILTNDGDFVYEVTHPKHEITKTYNATLSGIITEEAVRKLRTGVEIEESIENKVSPVRTENTADKLKMERRKMNPVKALLKENVKIEADNNKTKVYKTRPAKVRILKIDEEKNISRIEITIHEGKNRQIRKMCEGIGYKVIALHRSKIGNIVVKDLKLGTWRFLKKSEIENLLRDNKKMFTK